MKAWWGIANGSQTVVCACTVPDVEELLLFTTGWARHAALDLQLHAAAVNLCAVIRDQDANLGNRRQMLRDAATDPELALLTGYVIAPLAVIQPQPGVLIDLSSQMVRGLSDYHADEHGWPDYAALGCQIVSAAFSALTTSTLRNMEMRMRGPS